MSSMNRQEVFDRVCTHAFTQNEQADDGYGCRYRLEVNGGDELKCFVGCLIDSEHYRVSFEGSGPETGVIATAIERSLGCSLDAKDLLFLYHLQAIHDDNEPELWETKLEEFANKYNLLTTVDSDDRRKQYPNRHRRAEPSHGGSCRTIDSPGAQHQQQTATRTRHGSPGGLQHPSPAEIPKGHLLQQSNQHLGGPSCKSYASVIVLSRRS